jgi:hypothetical protein
MILLGLLFMPGLMILLVLLLILPTLDSHPNSFVSFLVLLLIFPTIESDSNSFVSTAWPNDFTSLTVNLHHSWLSL